MLKMNIDGGHSKGKIKLVSGSLRQGLGVKAIRRCDRFLDGVTKGHEMNLIGVTIILLRPNPTEGSVCQSAEKF